MSESFEVDVVDAKNKEWLLGHLRNPPVLSCGRKHVAYATYCHPGVVSSYGDPPPTLPLGIEHVDLFVEWVTENEGYTRRAVFLTHTPLKILSRIREFRFPGESAAAAQHRVYYG